MADHYYLDVLIHIESCISKHLHLFCSFKYYTPYIANQYIFSHGFNDSK